MENFSFEEMDEMDGLMGEEEGGEWVFYDCPQYADEWVDYEITNEDELRFIASYFEEYDRSMRRAKIFDRWVSLSVVLFCLCMMLGIWILVWYLHDDV